MEYSNMHHVIAQGESSTHPQRAALNAATASSKPRAFHRRSGVLKTTTEQAMIAKQRSQALFHSVSEGQISIDAILAFPIDWQGVANQQQWCKMREAQGEEIMPTMNPLATKNRSRPRQESSSIQSPSFASTPSSNSILGLDLRESESNSESPFISSPSSVDDHESDCASSPNLSSSFNFSRPNSPSGSEFSIPTPPSSPLYAIEECKFDLKSYCSVFNEADRDAKEWWTISSSTPIHA